MRRSSYSLRQWPRSSTITASRCAVRKSNRRYTTALLVLGGLALGGSSGCVQMAGLWANVSGGDVVKPEFNLTKGPLLILIDDREGIVTEAQAMRQLHKSLSDVFLETDTNRRVIPYENWQALQQSAKDYSKLSIREIGEKLGADQVLYLRVERFALHDEPGSPVLKGSFVVRLKILSTEAKHDVRLWPRDEKGKRIEAASDPYAPDSGKSAGDVAKEAAIKLAGAIGALFYEHRSLDK